MTEKSEILKQIERLKEWVEATAEGLDRNMKRAGEAERRAADDAEDLKTWMRLIDRRLDVIGADARAARALAEAVRVDLLREQAEAANGKPE